MLIGGCATYVRMQFEASASRAPVNAMQAAISQTKENNEEYSDEWIHFQAELQLR
jgi:hypothetical protein